MKCCVNVLAIVVFFVLLNSKRLLIMHFFCEIIVLFLIISSFNYRINKFTFINILNKKLINYRFMLYLFDEILK